MNVSEAIEKRKSVRAYIDKPVDQTDIEKIIDAGRQAPNAGPFHISLIADAGLRKRINDATLEAMLNSGIEFLQKRASLPGYQPVYGASVLMLLSGPDANPFSAVNTALAAENMMLEATGMGLGTCFLISPTLALNGGVNPDLAREAGVPEGYSVKCAVIAGYPAAEDNFTLGERTKKGTVNYAGR